MHTSHVIVLSQTHTFKMKPSCQLEDMTTCLLNIFLSTLETPRVRYFSMMETMCCLHSTWDLYETMSLLNETTHAKENSGGGRLMNSQCAKIAKTQFCGSRETTRKETHADVNAQPYCLRKNWNSRHSLEKYYGTPASEFTVSELFISGVVCALAARII